MANKKLFNPLATIERGLRAVGKCMSFVSDSVALLVKAMMRIWIIINIKLSASDDAGAFRLGMSSVLLEYEGEVLSDEL